MTATTQQYAQLDQWIDAHFDEQVKFLQALVQVPTDTPPGNNAPHAAKTTELLKNLGYEAEQFPVPEAGLTTRTNLIVRRPFGPGGKTIALNAHGDVVPPGEGWTRPPYGAEIENGHMYGRATAVSKCDFSTFTYALRAVEALRAQQQLALKGSVELHFTYDEEFGGEMGPGWLLEKGVTKPDLMIAAGFSYQVVTAHNGCLQMEVTVHGKMAHAAIPETGVDALQAAVHILNNLYAQNKRYQHITSKVEGINHPYLNVGRIEGGTNTNVVPGTVSFKLDRRMIPEENPQEVEANIRQVIAQAVAEFNEGRAQDAQISIDIKRLLMAHAMKPLAGNAPLVQAIQQHGGDIFGEPIPAMGTPLYTDVRLYVEKGIPGVIYGAGPRTVLESHAKRADERLNLDDLRKATKVISRTLLDLLQA
jgi:acetylornithine deacetylase/succinyl-diaminopimelate desuccinylase family protein